MVGIFGDGVNVAARLEGLADPGGICVSARVQEDVAGKLELTLEDIGSRALKTLHGQYGYTGFAIPPPRTHRR